MRTAGRRGPGRGASGGRRAALAAAGVLLPLALALAGCSRDGHYQPLGMWNEARLKPFEASPMAGRLGSARPPVPGTVARGQYFPADPVYTGRRNGALVATSPIPITRALLERGQERFNLTCTPCHGRLGDGAGMVVQRGFPHPPDYAIPRLRKARIGHFFDVMTNGYGVMYSYAQAVRVQDRWAIASYIRVLQNARPVVKEDLFLEERLRARERFIQDPTRPMRVLPEEGPEGGGHSGAEPASPGPAAAPAH